MHLLWENGLCSASVTLCLDREGWLQLVDEIQAALAQMNI